MGDSCRNMSESSVLNVIGSRLIFIDSFDFFNISVNGSLVVQSVVLGLASFQIKRSNSFLIVSPSDMSGCLLNNRNGGLRVQDNMGAYIKYTIPTNSAVCPKYPTLGRDEVFELDTEMVLLTGCSL